MSSPSAFDATALSRRELQYLARELELCRGNAKSDVITNYLLAFMAADDGAAQVTALLEEMPEEYKLRTPGTATTTPTRRTRGNPQQEVTPRAIDFGDEVTPSRRSARKPVRSAREEEKPCHAHQKSNGGVDLLSTTVPVERTMNFEGQEAENVDEPSGNEAAVDIETNGGVALNTAGVAQQVFDHDAVKVANKSGPVTHALKPVKTPSVITTPVKNERAALANVTNLPTVTSAKASARLTVEGLLKQHDDLVSVGSDRVKCITTGHEMKADFDIISAHLSGKRYMRARNQSRSFASYAPMFVDHPDEKQPHLLWCTVTQAAIARSVDRIEAHMHGARYQQQLPEWREEQAERARAKHEEEEARRSKDNTVAAKSRKRKAPGAGTDQHPMKSTRT